MKELITKLEITEKELEKSALEYKMQIVKDISALHHQEEKNRLLFIPAIGRVFPRAGTYMFNLGFVTFCDVVAVSFLAQFYCYQVENEKQIAIKEVAVGSVHIEEVSWTDQNIYLLLTLGAYFGDIIASGFLQAAFLTRPYLATLCILLNMILWIINATLFRLISHPFMFFLWMMFIGGLD